MSLLEQILREWPVNGAVRDRLSFRHSIVAGDTFEAEYSGLQPAEPAAPVSHMPLLTYSLPKSTSLYGTYSHEAADIVTIPREGMTLAEHEHIERALTDSAQGRTYSIGPDDLEEYVNLTDAERAKLHASRESLDAWLATHAAKYR